MAEEHYKGNKITFGYRIIDDFDPQKVINPEDRFYFVQVQTAASVAKGAETVDVRAVVSAHDFGTALTGLVQILNATGEALHLPTTKIETPGLTAREDWTVQALF